MSALVRLLYPVAAPRSVPAIIGWWERRRLAYNVAVGLTGLVTLGVVAVFSLLPPSTGLRIPWVAPVAYGVLANVCYTLGWFIESGLHVAFRGEIRPVGPLLFRQGVAFAIGLTLLPTVVAGVAWLARVAWAIF